jgi:DNA (cytosine-5)-methyltransferase 1
MAMKRYGVNHKSVGVSEIDKNAIIAYDSVHGGGSIEPLPNEEMFEWLRSKNIGYDFKKSKSTLKLSNKFENKRLYIACKRIKNIGDISLIDPDTTPNMDIFTYSFPCTDISVAGRGEGMAEGSGTRSGLLWECREIIVKKQPKFLMMENVKNLVGKKFKPFFDLWLQELEELGYNSYWKVINAKMCGVPQNRERVFCVSIKKELDKGQFSFNEEFDNGVRLKDILENTVDEKYYLSDEKTKSLIQSLESKGYHGIDGYRRNYECDGNSYCLDANYSKGTSAGDVGKARRTHVIEANVFGIDKSVKNTRIIDVANCITAREDRGISNRGGEGTAVLESRVILTEARSEEAKKIRRESLRSGKDFSPRRGKILKERTDDICNCITTSMTKEHLILEKPRFRIRKLTPRECFRLMGVSEEDIDKIQAAGISDSQQYKLAGNSIVVDCMKFLEKLQ